MTDRRQPQRSGESAPRRARARDDEPVLPSRSRDDSDVGWGDERAERDAEWYHRERPPHHGD
ncbi:hypothetical protein SAMN05443575_4096 [Jatrophihabitans endophyticus]|uniref:Uncharacterized protein n=1 Tax=Jatrophihabitans endophyticus TaxID=1206085 RepID=A0A1M5U0C3_9ACTN|nr:hypothetical protein [Jatrophihabitans endophyticus]SHH56477.1 hypothetical protein SAMN05443575_4096 [Jatrophihabitans endophyticus]